MNTHEDFRNVIREERENLTRLSDFWNTQVKCDQGLSRDTQGRIRAAVGKTRLLLAEKFKQFEGLIDQSENNTAEKEITINDLQGFWDLVSIQVNEIQEMFRDLAPLGDKYLQDGKKQGKARGPVANELEQKEIKSFTKKKSSNDYIDQAEKKLKEVLEKDKAKGSNSRLEA